MDPSPRQPAGRSRLDPPVIGTLYAVGVGPGDPELLTLKAARVLRASDVIAAPMKGERLGLAYQIAEQAIPDIRSKEALPLSFPMTTDSAAIARAHAKAESQIERLLSAGKTVSLVTLGDPSLYSSCAYVIEGLRRKQYPVQTICGIPSFCAAAARLNLSLASGDGSIRISTPEKANLGSRDTLVILKAGGKLRELKAALAHSKRDVYLIENCGMPEERAFHGLKSIPDQADYLSLLIVQ